MRGIKKNRHAVFSLQYDLVVTTKYRKKCITKDMMIRLKEISQNLFEKWGCDVLEISGEEDHIHILFEAHPQIELLKTINNLKTVTSRYIRKEFEQHLTQYYWKPYFWNRSCLVLSTGDDIIDIIKQYIENQQEPEK